MPQRVIVVVNGNSYTVETEDPAARPLQVTVNGRAYTVEVRPAEAPAAPRPASAPGVRPVRPAPLSTAAGDGEVRAPMPGNILDIAVRPGERVDRGQMLCALEAMKMKSAIRSPRAGVLQAVEVTEGQAVAHGAVLFRFE